MVVSWLHFLPSLMSNVTVQVACPIPAWKSNRIKTNVSWENRWVISPSLIRLSDFLPCLYVTKGGVPCGYEDSQWMTYGYRALWCRERCFHAKLSHPYLHLWWQNAQGIGIHDACEGLHFAVQVAEVWHIGHNDMWVLRSPWLHNDGKASNRIDDIVGIEDLAAASKSVWVCTCAERDALLESLQVCPGSCCHLPVEKSWCSKTFRVILVVVVFWVAGMDQRTSVQWWGLCWVTKVVEQQLRVV